VLEKEVRRLADSAASAARFDAEAQARKSELEMAAVDMVKASATEVLRMREQMEALRRDVADLKSELAEKHTALVLAEGKVPLVQAAANVAAVAADAKKTTAAVAAPAPAAAAASNGNGNGSKPAAAAAAPAKK
jgi:chromosome segregation ATPase